VLFPGKKDFPALLQIMIFPKPENKLVLKMCQTSAFILTAFVCCFPSEKKRNLFRAEKGALLSARAGCRRVQENVRVLQAAFHLPMPDL